MNAGKSAAIFDLDGTLCDVSSVRHHVEGFHRNFEAFWNGSLSCPPIGWVAEAARKHHEDGLAVLIVTGRRAVFRDGTAEWLDRHRIPYDALWMRENRDFRKDVEYKGEALSVLQIAYGNIVMAYDDSTDVIEGVWKKYGIPVTAVDR